MGDAVASAIIFGADGVLEGYGGVKNIIRPDHVRIGGRGELNRAGRVEVCDLPTNEALWAAAGR